MAPPPPRRAPSALRLTLLLNYSKPVTIMLLLELMFSLICCPLRRRQWCPLQCSCLENPMDGGARWAAATQQQQLPPRRPPPPPTIKDEAWLRLTHSASPPSPALFMIAFVTFNIFNRFMQLLHCLYRS